MQSSFTVDKGLQMLKKFWKLSKVDIFRHVFGGKVLICHFG